MQNHLGEGGGDIMLLLAGMCTWNHRAEEWFGISRSNDLAVCLTA